MQDGCGYTFTIKNKVLRYFVVDLSLKDVNSLRDSRTINYARVVNDDVTVLA